MSRFNVDKEPVESIVQEDTNQMTKKEANEKLSEIVAEVYEKLAQAQKLADQYELSFSLDVEYGMGGSYEEGEWHPSSQSC